MPAVSKQQQKFMGLVLAYKRGEVPASKVSKNVKQVAAKIFISFGKKNLIFFLKLNCFGKMFNLKKRFASKPFSK